MKQPDISETQRLRMLLKSQATKLSAEAIQADGQLSAARLQELAEMEKLIQILDAAEPPAKPSRWPMIALLSATLVIVSILLFARVAATEINLNVSLSEVNFRLSQQQVISNGIQLSSLGIAGLQEIEFPETGSSENDVSKSGESSGNAIRLVIDTTYRAERLLTLAPLLLHSTATVWIGAVTENAAECHLLLKDSQLVIKADVKGIIETGEPGIPSRQINFPTPKSVVLRAGTDEVDISVSPLIDVKNIFKEQIFIDSLSFFHIEEYMDEQHTVLQQVSGVNNGSIYFESLGGTERSLHPAEEIRFKKLKGYINQLVLENGHISFTFRGTVSGMTTGGKEDRISLMPTYLEWLMARHSLSLLWGTTIYFLGILLSVAHWWKTTK